jgi:hypothetical protein
MNQKEMFSKKSSMLLNLNMKFIDEYKELIIPLIKFSNKNEIPLSQNTLYLMYELNRQIRNIGSRNWTKLMNNPQNTKEYKQFNKYNLFFLETIKELMNALIAYSEKNGIPVPLKIYHLVFEANKLHQNLISDEFLQGHRTDEDLTVP